MEVSKKLPLRPYQALIWKTDSHSIEQRKIYLAVDSDDAKKQAIDEYGEDFSFSIWNEEDAAKPR